MEVKTPTINLHHGDCLEAMKQMPDKAYDLAIVDPPYGIGASKPSKKTNTVKQKNGSLLHVPYSNYSQKDWDNETPKQDYFEQLFRVSKKQIIWGSNYFGLVGGVLVWDKLNGKSDQYDAELAWLSWTKEVRTVYFMWCGMFQGQSCSENIHDALRQQGNKSLNEKRIHPTQKPVALYKWLLHNYAKEGDKILDTHGGSGSICIAVHEVNQSLKMGLSLDWYELDSEYYNLAKKRYENHISQLSLL